jgi:two-component system, NarL family, sensor kinase
VLLRRQLRRLIPGKGQARQGTFRPVLQFVVTGVLALVVVAAVGSWLLSRASASEALHNAEVVTETLGRGVVAPLITPELVAGDAGAIATMDAAIRDRVPESIQRVKIWSPEGRIIYSDEHRLIGQRFSLAADLATVLRSGETEAENEADVADAENLYERSLGALFEVYVPLSTTTGNPVVLEAYQDRDEFIAARRRLLEAYLPAALGALLVLWLAQLPLVFRLARRLEARRREREDLLRRAVEASDAERRRIASDLHDGVVQDLAGIQFTLEGAANRADASGAADMAADLRRAADDTRQGMRRLRGLLVEIHPPNLRALGLQAALTDMVGPLENRGFTVSLDVPGDLDLDEKSEELLYRVAQEGIRNVVKHSGASEVQVGVRRDNGLVRLTVADDGRGFTPEERAARHAEGHMGLTLIGELVTEAAGRLDVTSTPGGGTRLVLEVPQS